MTNGLMLYVLLTISISYILKMILTVKVSFDQCNFRAIHPDIVIMFMPILFHSELYRREFLDKCISRALNVPLQDGRLLAIDEENYVLTLDFTIKMLQIHERYECGEPIILQGETGVGKTSLLQMLSKLWNVSLDMELKRLKERVLEFLQSKLKCGK